MKPLLQLQIPTKCSSEQFSSIITVLQNKLLRDYEVIVVPEGSGIDIQTEGMIKLVIDPTTNIDNLIKDFSEFVGINNIIGQSY